MTVTEDRLAAVTALFSERGYSRIDPPILQPADVFLDLIGEDIRGRLFLSADLDGRDLCLRPDFTIPVCRKHMEDGPAERQASYCYGGPVFRQRPGESGEFLQAGVESLGRADCEAADADMLALALEALDRLGARTLSVRIGDEALFAAVLDGLDLPKVWKRRLRDLFGERPRLDQAIARMGGREARENGDDTGDGGARLGFLAALEGADPAAAQAVVEDLLSIAGINAVGGRSAAEIAERFLEQAALKSRAGVNDEAANVLTRFLDIAGDPEGAVTLLDTFAAETGVDLSEPIGNFQARLEALAARGIDIESLTFSADFGRRLDYYTGFVFEIHSPAAAGPVVGGGRYDRLIELIGASQAVPAVGFSIWLDRVGGKA